MAGRQGAAVVLRGVSARRLTLIVVYLCFGALLAAERLILRKPHKGLGYSAVRD